MAIKGYVMPPKSYVVMPWYPGTLSGHLASHGPMGPDAATPLALHLAKGLLYLHDNNIIHRDIKSSNILVRSTNPIECVIADFGIARSTDGTRTMTGYMGTPAYSAPEVSR